MSKRSVKIWIRVSSQTADHLKDMAAAENCSPGRIVDKLVRACRLSRKGYGPHPVRTEASHLPTREGNQERSLKYDKK